MRSDRGLRSFNEEPTPAAALRRAIIALARRLRTEGPPDGLSPARLAVLSRLRREGPVTAGRLAASELQQPQSLTRVLADLERLGLLVRSPGETDRRQSLLRITEAGRAAVERDAAARDAWLAMALQGLSETERGVLAIAAPIMERLALSEAAADDPESGA